MNSGHKHTELGIIPSDWEVISIGEFAGGDGNIVDGPFGSNLTNSDYVSEGVPVLQGLNITGDRFQWKEVRYITEQKARELVRSDARVGDLLTIKKGTIGFSALIDDLAGHRFAIIPANLIRVRFLAQGEATFAYYALTSRAMKKRLTDIAVNTAQPAIVLSGFRRLTFAAPKAVKEQRAIAEALSDVDALIESLDQLIAKKRDIKQAAMQELLTGQRRLPGFSGEWEVKRLGEIASIVMGQSPESRHYNRSGDGVPLIQGNADIENRRSIRRVWTTLVTKECRQGDILLTVRAPVGEVGVASEHSCLGRGVCAIRAVSVDAGFLFQALVHAEQSWKMLEQGSTFTSANSTQIVSFALALAPTLQEQCAIAEVLSDIDAELAALEQRRDKTRALKQGMMQELLTGRTRLI